jgi:ubiquitin-like 1-activating enzyme E1 B
MTVRLQSRGDMLASITGSDTSRKTHHLSISPHLSHCNREWVRRLSFLAARLSSWAWTRDLFPMLVDSRAAMEPSTRAQPCVSSLESLSALRVLLVGAGGIGCELAHGLVQLGVGCLHLVDLDRVDASNLNRQFLFRRSDIGRLKSEAVVANLGRTLPGQGLELVAHAGDVRDTTKFSWNFFRSFDVVLNALDNLEARQHVNKMCIATRRLLIDTGSAGYLGQVVPILPGVSECYQCTPKSGTRQFAVCTIRSNPEKPAHCVAWAKHLFNHLFAPESAAESMLSDLDCRWDGQETPAAYTVRLLRFLFVEEVTRQAAIRQEAGEQRRPRPLEGALLDDLETLTQQQQQQQQQQRLEALDERFAQQTSAWDVSTCLAVLNEVVPRLCSCSKPRTFDKDDAEALAFVTAMSNLRAHCYRVEPLQSPFEVKGIAGGIVHAIAATNAMVAGLALTELCKWHQLVQRTDNATDLKRARSVLRCVFVLRTPTPSRSRSESVLLLPEALAAPNKDCSICSRGKVAIALTSALTQVTLGQFIRECLHGQLGIGTEAALLIGLCTRDARGEPCVALLYEDPDPADAITALANGDSPKDIGNNNDDDDDDEDERCLWRANCERSLASLGVEASAELQIDAVQRKEEHGTQFQRLRFDVYLVPGTENTAATETNWRILEGSSIGEWETLPLPSSNDPDNERDENNSSRPDSEVDLIEIDATDSETMAPAEDAAEASIPRKRYRASTESPDADTVLLIDP